ncbi:hypothetical protein [Dysgonomonas reticulitermitis]
MSNIHTSYVRIKRRDGRDMSGDEVDYLFNNVVNVHGDFGSYWVRIVKKYRASGQCLNIQFGSGKRTENILRLPEIFKEYYVVERINYEHSLDHIFEYGYKEGDAFASETPPRLCKYAFDKVIITCEENWLKKEGAEWMSSDTQELLIDGSYYCCNCRSYVDVYDDSEYYGTQIGYTEDYPYDYFVLTESSAIQFIDPPFLEQLCAGKFVRMPRSSKMEFLYKHRKVLSIRKTGLGNIEISSADHWDNCVDEAYLEMRKKLKTLK